MTSAPLVQKLWIFWPEDESLADSDILSRPEAIAQGNVDQSGPTTRLLLALWPQRSDNARVRGTPRVLAVIDPQAPSLPARSGRR